LLLKHLPKNVKSVDAAGSAVDLVAIYIVYGKPLFSSPAVLICQMIRTYQKLSQERGGEIENLTNFATLRTLHWMFSPAVITSAQQAINPFNSQRQQNNLQEKLN
jgi:hypothetical protein